jgi:hypothetical protein
MKQILIVLAFIISTNVTFAQGKDENSSLSRKEKRKIEDARNYELTKSMLENKNFVLQADYLQDRWGKRYWVDHGINFVSVDSTTAIIQIGSNYRLGANGVGGVTAKGTISNWKLTENSKNKTFDVQLTVMTTIGIYDLFFSVGSSGRATARLTGLRPGQLTFDGNLVPWEDSSVFEGWSL